MKPGYLTDPDIDIRLFSGARHLVIERHLRGGWQLVCQRCGIHGTRLYQSVMGPGSSVDDIKRIVAATNRLAECEPASW